MKKQTKVQQILLLFLLCYLLAPIKSTAQDNIRWKINEKSSTDRTITNISYLDPTNFIALRYRYGQKGKNYFSRYVDFLPVQEIEIKLPSSYSITTLESSDFLSGYPTAFFSDYKKGKFIVYAQKYTKNCELEGTPLKITEFETTRKLNVDNCHFIYSKDKSKVAIGFENDKKDDIKISDYVILNANLEILAQGNFEQTESRSIFLDGRAFLTDKGELFCLNSIEKSTEEENSNKGWILDHFLVYKMNENGLEKIKINASDDLRIVSSVSINIYQANKIMINGVFGEKHGDTLATKGIFNIITDTSKENGITEKIYRFENGFVEDIWSESHIKGMPVYNFLAEKLKATPNLKSKYSLTLQDGSMIGSYEFEEQIFSHKAGVPSGVGVDYSSGMYPTGMTQNRGGGGGGLVASTISKGTFLFKIDTLGNFSWFKEIPKFKIEGSSLTTSSYLFEHGNNLTLMFSDHSVNYSDGIFIGEPTIKMTDAIAKKRVTAMVEVDLATGENKRTCLTGKEAINLSAIMGGFYYDPQNKLLYASHLTAKLLEKFAIIPME